MNKALLALMLSGSVLTAPPALYDPAPPPDSAFVRFVNATPGARSASLDAQTLSAAPLEYSAASTYRVFKAGRHSLSSGAQQREVTLTAGGFYTTALIARRWWINKNQSATTLTQTRIALYNLSSTAVSLKTGDGQLTLHADLPALEYAMSPVNPVKVKLAVFADRKVHPLPEVQLEANSAYSVIVVGEAGKLRVAWLQNTTESR